jgi:hypothetical protein
LPAAEHAHAERVVRRECCDRALGLLGRHVDEAEGVVHLDAQRLDARRATASARELVVVCHVGCSPAPPRDAAPEQQYRLGFSTRGDLEAEHARLQFWTRATGRSKSVSIGTGYATVAAAPAWQP